MYNSKFSQAVEQIAVQPADANDAMVSDSQPLSKVTHPVKSSVISVINPLQLIVPENQIDSKNPFEIYRYNTQLRSPVWSPSSNEKLLLDSGVKIEQEQCDQDEHSQVLPRQASKEAFFNAIESGDVLRCEHEIDQQNRRVDIQFADGTTPLILAIKHGHEKICSLLLSAGADVNKPDEESITPLYAAVYYGSLSLCKMLLEAGAELSHHTFVNDKFLAAFPRWKQYQNFRAADQVDATPTVLQLALEEKKEAIFFYLAEQYSTPYRETVTQHDLSILFQALESEVILNQHQENALHIAVKLGDSGVIASLFKHNAHTSEMARAKDYRGKTPLHLAVGMPELKLVVTHLLWHYRQSMRPVVPFALNYDSKTGEMVEEWEAKNLAAEEVGLWYASQLIKQEDINGFTTLMLAATNENDAVHDLLNKLCVQTAGMTLQTLEKNLEILGLCLPISTPIENADACQVTSTSSSTCFFSAQSHADVSNNDTGLQECLALLEGGSYKF